MDNLWTTAQITFVEVEPAVKSYTNNHKVEAVVVIYNHLPSLNMWAQSPWAEKIFFILCLPYQISKVTQKDLEHPVLQQPNFFYIQPMTNFNPSPRVTFESVLTIVHYLLEPSVVFLLVTDHGCEIGAQLKNFDRQVLIVNPAYRHAVTALHFRLHLPEVIVALQNSELDYQQAQEIVQSVTSCPSYAVWVEIYHHLPDVKFLYPGAHTTSTVKIFPTDELRGLFFRFWTGTRGQFSREYHCPSKQLSNFLNRGKSSDIARETIASFLLHKVLT